MAKYKDIIYGNVLIKEPVLAELINSPSLQRLKDIDQAGYYEPHFPGSKHNRFDHSLGVCLLLKKYDASIEEQIAGLIHDVSHSAFSHCIDFVLAKESQQEQCHQDEIFIDYARQTEIPGILKKHGYGVDYILNQENFPLLETDLPDLCADRIDYSLRGLIAFKIAGAREVHGILDELKTVNNSWVFKNRTAAERYAELFNNLNKNCYCALPTAAMFASVSAYLLYALDKNYINRDDLYRTDAYVLNKINRHLPNDKELNRFWKRMNNGQGYRDDPKNFDAKVLCKSRAVDPLFLDRGQAKRLSDADVEWKRIVEEEMKPKEYFVKFLD